MYFSGDESDSNEKHKRTNGQFVDLKTPVIEDSLEDQEAKLAAYQRVRSLDEQLCRGEIPAMSPLPSASQGNQALENNNSLSHATQEQLHNLCNSSPHLHNICGNL